MDRIDVEQARRRAKELLRAARAGDADAIARLPRRHDPIVLADAQFAVARELGFASWPKLVASTGWVPARYGDVDWLRVRRATFVPFIADRDQVVIPEEGLPSGVVRPGEDVVLDTALRIPLEQAGFRRQGTHVFALADGGEHVAIWIDGDRYRGDRPHRREAQWWVGDPAEVDDELVLLAEQARRSLTHAEDQEDLCRVLEPSYLLAETPQGGSGFGGTLAEWTDRRRMIVDAIDCDGTFLDVGCANGFLMESVVAWCAEAGHTVEPHGLDVSAALVERARERLPQWSDRIWVGDALTWTPPRTFDIVHALLDVVPMGRRRDLIEHLRTFVTPGGRLVLSQYGTTMPAREVLARLGYAVDGETRAPTSSGNPSVWIEVSGHGTRDRTAAGR